MRIGIDCRLAGKSHAGIGRYIENLVNRVPDLATDIDWVFFFHDQAQADAVLAIVKQRDRVSTVIAPIRHYSVSEQTKMASIFTKAKLDLLHVPHFNVPLLYRRPLVVTIHDLLWHEYHGPHVTTLKPWKYWFKYGAYRLVARAAIQKARSIFVPAQTIKKTLSKYYPKLENKVVVTKEGVFSDLHRPTQISKSTFNKEKGRKYLLYVGSLYPHKNVELVVKALAELPEYTLLLVGSRNVFQDDFRKKVDLHGVASQVIFLGYKSDAELTHLYQEVDAVVQPSLSEGFGLTGVEAMAAKVPLLASQIPIFQEVYQDGAIYFDPHTVSSFINAIHKLEDTNKTTLIKRGQKVVSSYSWDEMAEQTVAEYRRALSAS